jgi:hypothetical protein
MGELRMSGKERVRLEAFGRVKSGQWTVVRAAEACGLSVRQARRAWKRYRATGDAGLVHAGRGRASNNRLDEATRERIVGRFVERYADFGPTHACEKLSAEGLAIGPDTLTMLLKAKGLWRPRRRRGKHRSRRERRSCFGALVQMDGSPHDWFEGRSEPCCLMVAVDDATGRMLARFYPRETGEAAFDLFGRWVTRYGVPRSLYVDRAGIYRPEREATAAETLEAKGPVTQFGRAMLELGVELILANSPQAKGRVERKNGVLQDRLVKEMRLAGVNSPEAGNAFLEGGYVDEHNARYGVEPRDGIDEHRRPSEVLAGGVDLAEVLCVREERVVGRDWCVRWENRWLQIGKEHESLGLAGRKVTVSQKADRSLTVRYRGVRLRCTEMTGRPRPQEKRTKPVIKNNKRWRPAPDHPHRRPIVQRRAG